MKLLLATHNKHKIMEIGNVISHPLITIESLLDYPDIILPPETGATFVENARVKARTVYEYMCRGGALSPPNLGGHRGPPLRTPSHDRTIARSHRYVLADDSGLCVDALNGRPGIYSSRYSGEPARLPSPAAQAAGGQVDYARNNSKLLSELKGVPAERRTAHFICSMVLIDPLGKEYKIEGRVNGLIAAKESGVEGFGYDPVFYLPDRRCTIAELPLSEKSKISHRGLAARKALDILVEFLEGDVVRRI